MSSVAPSLRSTEFVKFVERRLHQLIAGDGEAFHLAEQASGYQECASAGMAATSVATISDSIRTACENRGTGFPGSFRVNSSFTNDNAVFLMVPDNQFAKWVAIAKIDIKSKRRHVLLAGLMAKGEGGRDWNELDALNGPRAR